MAELREAKIELRFIMCADCLYKAVGEHPQPLPAQLIST
jgi:hypothetical protein